MNKYRHRIYMTLTGRWVQTIERMHESDHDAARCGKRLASPVKAHAADCTYVVTARVVESEVTVAST